MKAKELMLFDLIRRKKDGKSMTVVELRYAETIAAITPDDVYYGDMEDYHESEIEPIPLTSEILEKNGFKKEGSWFIIEDDYYDISIKEITDSIWRVKYCNTEFSAFDCVLHIAFVHELQHALKLCGIDKEIVI